MVREGYDLAIRAGNLGETSGFGRKIASLETLFFATPEYLDQHGRPEKPEDLRRLKYIQHNDDKNFGGFDIKRNGESFHTPVRVGFTVDDPELIFKATRAGAGYTRAARILVQDEITAGIYEEILPSYQAPPKDVFAISPTRLIAGSKVDLVINAFVSKLSELQQETRAANTNVKLTA